MIALLIANCIDLFFYLCQYNDEPLPWLTSHGCTQSDPEDCNGMWRIRKERRLRVDKGIVIKCRKCRK